MEKENKMRAKKMKAPTMNKDGGLTEAYGYCPECGKVISLRNQDGMLRKHGRDLLTGLWCFGSNMLPSKAIAEVMKNFGKDEWTPARRSN